MEEACMILDVYSLSVCVCGGGGCCAYVSHVCEMEQSRNLCFLESFSQAGSRDFSLSCCNVCTWTQLSSSYKIQRNNIGLKITVCLGTWGKFCTKRYKKTKKKKNPHQNCHFWRSRSKNRVLRKCPARNTTKGWANHLSHSSSLTPGHTPTFNPFKE